MKNYIVGSLFALSTASVFALPPFCQSHGYSRGDKVFGDVNCEKGKVAALSVYGNTDLEHTTISQSLSVHGHLDAEHVNFGQVNVYGYAKLKHAEVKDDLIVHGALSAKHAEFKGAVKAYGHLAVTATQLLDRVRVYGDVNANHATFTKSLKVYGHHTVLVNSQANDIVVSNHLLTPSVTLEGKTIITGDIRFVKKPGIVYQDKQSKLEGKVFNGKIEHKHY